jgi:hypothetical protein
MRILV